MESNALNLDHQVTLEKKFKELNLPLSEYSFANLYLFRSLHHYEVLTFNDDLFIKGLTREQVSYIMLTAHPLAYSELALRSALLHADILFPIPDSWLPCFASDFFEASFKEEDSDYLFSLNKLANYPGRHLSKKRNLVKQLKTQHQIQAMDLIDQTDDAIQILENWRQEHGPDPVETDFEACLEAIHNFQNLHLHGRIIYVDDSPAGFTIGEMLSTDCYVIHFCKGLKAIKGLYQDLYQDLALSLDASCAWINLEQDLGIVALREAKHSYLPDRSLLKWRVRLKL